MYAKQNTAKTFLVGPILDADGAAKTDEVIGSIKVTKNGTVGAPNASSTLTHNHTGHYTYVADAGDFDTLGEVEFSLNSGTNAMAPVRFMVVPANVYDAMVSGTDKLEVDATQWDGSTVPVFPANFASLGINASGHVSRVTLVDTCTQNSDMRGTDGAATPADLGDLQTHGDSNWTTATGFATRDDLQALQAHGDEAWASTDTSGLATSDALVQVATAVEAMQQALASGVLVAGESVLAIREGLSTFNPSQHGVMLTAQQPAYAPAKAGDPMALAAEERGAVATAMLDLADGIEANITLRDAIRIIAAAVAGLVSGAGSGVERFKGLDQTTDRLTVFVDEAGNRTGITYHR